MRNYAQQQWRALAARSAASAPLCKGSWHAVGVTEGLYPRQGIAFTPNFDNKIKSVLCGGAASAPSEEGAVKPFSF